MDEIIQKSEYRFERLQPKHYVDLVYISKSAFGINPGVNYYLNKNKTNCFGESNLGYIAYHILTNEPAAFYGVYSHPFKFKNQKYLVVQSGDTMTHKNHTNKGLFVELAKLTYALAQSKGASLVFGFPNENSYPGFVRKLNWVHKNNIASYTIKTRTIPLLKLTKKLPLLKTSYHLYLKIINSLCGNQIEVFENSASSIATGTIEHSNDFFNYKKFNGSYLIEINNIKLWLKADGFLYIGDIGKINNSYSAQEIILKIKRYAKLIGADVIKLGFSPNSFWDQILGKELSSEQGAAFCYLLFDKNFPIDSFEYTLADLDTF
jgi:hypothetical protein